MGSKIIRTEKLFKVLLGLVILLFPFSLFFVVSGLLPASWNVSASIVIALQALLLLAWMAEQQPPVLAFRNFCLVLVVAFGVEYAGVSLGIPFGSYRYTTTLGAVFLGVPVVIPLAWYANAASSLGVARCLFSRTAHPLATGLAGACLVASFDIVLEPAASFIHHYWIWQENRIPWVNYLSWFSLALIIILFLRQQEFSNSPTFNFTPGLVYGMQWSLFALSDLAHGFAIPVILSLFLLTIILILGRKMAL